MQSSLKRFATPKNCIYALFVLAEAAIFVSFNVIVATRPGDPVYLKYSGVLLCLAVSAAMCFFYKSDAIILTCAIAFTAVSDYFILVIDAYYELGVTTFFIAQCFYLFRLYRGRLKSFFEVKGVKIPKIAVTVAARALIIAAVIITLAVTAGVNYLLVICSFYFVMLFANCIDAFVICGGGIKNVLFAVGLLLFVCCDICVGLHNFGSALGVALPRWLVNFVQYAIWVFYLPSQVLIVCSLDRGGLKIPPVKVRPGNGGESESEQTV